VRNHIGLHEISIDRAIELGRCEIEMIKLEHYIYNKFPNQIDGESAVDTAIKLLDSLSD
jgi:hypothetical protein